MSDGLELREALYQRELEIERLTAENERLRDALIVYGQHNISCDVMKPVNGGCTCGLNEALQPDKKDGTE